MHRAEIPEPTVTFLQFGLIIQTYILKDLKNLPVKDSRNPFLS